MEYDLRFKSPSCIIISGGSNSGKTYLIEQILKNHRACFQEPIEELHWVYHKFADNPTIFSRLTNSFNEQNIPITFHSEYPDSEITNNTLFKKPRSSHGCIVFDDIYQSPKQIPSLFNIWNILSHHQHFTAILVVQNLSGSTPNQKSALSTLLRSTNYLILFASRRCMPTVRNLAISLFPGENNKIIQPFKYLLAAQIPYNYLVIDLTTENELLLVRERGILSHEPCFGFTWNGTDTNKKENNSTKK